MPTKVTVYSMHHQQTIEDFILRWGAEIPKDGRTLFVEQLRDIIGLTGREAVDSFIEAFKQFGQTEKR